MLNYQLRGETTNRSPALRTQRTMKHYIRPTSRTGRLVTRLNRSFNSPQAAKDALKEWLSEANSKRRKTGQQPLGVRDFKIVSVEPHPFVRTKR